MKLFVGIGNPGKEYAHTRHNLGWIMLDYLCEKEGFTQFLPQKKFHAEIANGIIGKWQVIAIKPQTFVNKSGMSVYEVMNYYKIEPKDVLVFHDEIELPQGNIKLKFSGSAGGHNGIRDMIAKLGTDKFRKLKLGVGRPAHPEHQVSDYVLGEMSQSEKDQRRDLVHAMTEKVQEYLKNTG